MLRISNIVQSILHKFVLILNQSLREHYRNFFFEIRNFNFLYICIFLVTLM